MINYVLAANPKWYFNDATGKPAAFGTITLWSSLDHSTPKFVFARPDGTVPYLNPLRLDASGGTEVPIYWEINGVDLYYVVVRDRNGNLICTIDNFPDNNGGGVTPITSYLDIENHLVNGQFLFIDAINAADSLVTPAPTGITHIAPGCGFFKDTAGDYVPAIDPLIPSGWVYEKQGGTGVTDSIQFVDITVLGEGIPQAPSANATRYFKYSFTGVGTSPVTDSRLINIIPNVELFQDEQLTISFDTHANVADVLGAVEITQFFGAGGSGSVTTPAAFTFSGNAWARQHVVITVPNLIGKVKGPNQDDALFIQWVFPMNTVGEFSLANLQVQRGSFATYPYIEQTYAQDQYKVLIDLMVRGNILYRTGDYQWSDNVAARIGWFLVFNSAQSIGKATASTATSFGLEYKNLYILWWTIYDQLECVVNGGRGASALADFNANKKMSIPFHIVGSVFAVAGNSILVGFHEGEKTVSLTGDQNGPHTHVIRVASGAQSGSGADNPDGFGAPVASTESSGLGQAHQNMQPTVYKYLFVKL